MSLPPESSPRSARIILAAMLMLLLLALTTKPPPPRPGSPDEEGDLHLFGAVVARVRAGEPYYHAMGTELRSRAYPSASVFNWRTPVVYTALAARPRTTVVTFFVLATLGLASTLAFLIKQPPELFLVSLLAHLAAVVPLLGIPQSVLFTEAWAGLLIVLSVVAYGARRYTAGAVLGVLALFLRELAAPYCLVCGLVAFGQRRWREALVWTVGAGAFVAYFLFHYWQVQAHVGPGDLAHKQAWVQFGGLRFVLETIAFTGWFNALPTWSRAFGCVLLVASLWSVQAFSQLRAAVVVFLVFFAIVGQTFNHYWGLVSGPAWAFAHGFGVVGLWRLFVVARGGGAIRGQKPDLRAT